MRSKEEVKRYLQKLEETYISKEYIMTDTELSNIRVKIETAVELFRRGYDSRQIKEAMKNIRSVAMSKFEQARERIQKYLLSREYERGSDIFVKKEDALLLKWATNG